MKIVLKKGQEAISGSKQYLCIKMASKCNSGNPCDAQGEFKTSHRTPVCYLIIKQTNKRRLTKK